jgi:putative transposase
MSRKGNCYDNCYVESWFATLKKECIYRNNINCENQMRSLIFEYIETWHNNNRLHSSLGYLSPMNFKFNSMTA